MDDKAIKAIESVLAKGDRVELIPVKDGVKVMRIRRNEIKQCVESDTRSAERSEYGKTAIHKG